MRRLWPEAAEEDLDDLYRDLAIPPGGPHRPHVFLSMVSSLDGAASLGGRTLRLGGEGDRRAFRRLREHCDALLVGAGTVRREGYGSPLLDGEARARRRARGLEEVPRLVVVSASLDLDPAAGPFAGGHGSAAGADGGAEGGVPGGGAAGGRGGWGRPLILTVEDADPVRRRALRGVADLSAVGRERVELGGALRRLRRRGVTRLLCEGGPRLNAALLEAGLVDELFLTLTALVVGGPAPRIVDGPGGGPRGAELAEARVHDRDLLLRYRLLPGDGPGGA